jgi:hypothetical protein
MPDARALLEQVRTFEPDVLIHLGDIYYSGTPREVRDHFLSPIREVLEARMPRVLTLSGNHDRYSGGKGYCELLEELDQPASYFCLRNEHWQLIAMDTGLHDSDPHRGPTDMTYLEQSEVEWIHDKLESSGDRRTIFLSHHPLFSIEGAGHIKGRLLAVNPHQREAFRRWFPDIAAWFWGHEHDLLVYDEYVGLSRGRCIGAGAVPRLVGQQVRTAVSDLICPDDEKGPPTLRPGTRIGNNGEVENHVFAILELDGADATVSYYESDSSRLIPGKAPEPGSPLYKERL